MGQRAVEHLDNSYIRGNGIQSLFDIASAITALASSESLYASFGVYKFNAMGIMIFPF